MLNLKRNISLLLIVLILFSTNVVFAQSQGFDVEAKSAILMEFETGQILFRKNENLELPPASITKIMTLLLTAEAIEEGKASLDDQVEVSSFAESMGGSQAWLAEGETYPLKDLLKAVVLPSANDACVAVAEHIGGTEQNFVRMMNRRAKDLGLEHTHFVNTTGLPVEHGEHYTSAHDIAVMARELIQTYPKLLEWSSNRVDYIKNESLRIYTTNNLVGHYPGADGLKTGWTEKAEYCLAGTAQRGERRLISVVMKTDSQNARVEQSAELLDYGFKAFYKANLIGPQNKISQVAVKGGKQLEVPVATAQGFSAVIKRGTKELVKRRVEVTDKLEAPVKKGDKAGKIVFVHEDDPENPLGEVELVATKNVEKANIFVRIFRWLKDFIMGFFKK
ncbi:D-alanyl-D-alanine carboxypeptidase family protein [Halanaerobacter jeridensis]|uniref:serine-type D-Ala-D-Ala carboxypeptidase n=1 Tax=Halanaerobacter jeridensis TaxID=706427 RepID=A0A938XTE6_9FIRM|nr:D-alanyl-D-alanine carboxypeptidase family protein [Halanaerobacter jeridensis]MBM7557200.1 D-alanyl-D-alanine carboxypeptidase (penicillin-binding protein 5/6) [Halanaerobacter jeridensis]